jgi:hemerythrin-like metal-binding protein
MSSLFPGLIEWSSAYSVSIASIDKQHQVIVSMIRELQEAMLEGRASEVVSSLFQAMNKYTKFHFEYEEQLLKMHAYPNLNSHQGQHASLIAQLHELEDKYAGGELSAGAPLMHFLRRWLLDHIRVHDKEYASFLRKKGVS